jgi:DNA-binding GntR family transcriptional regulator
MKTLNVLAEENADRLLRENWDNRVRNNLLLFWGMHPNAKFAVATICHALDCSKLDVQRALGALAEAGLLDREVHNHVTLYSLSTDEERRRLIMEYAAPGHSWW